MANPEMLGEDVKRYGYEKTRKSSCPVKNWNSHPIQAKQKQMNPSPFGATCLLQTSTVRLGGFN